MDFLRERQLDVMMALCGICGIITLFAALTKSLPKRKKRLLILLELSAMLLLLSDHEAYVFRGDVSTLGYYMVRITNFMVYFMTLFVLYAFNLYLKDLYRNEGKLEVMPGRLAITEIGLLIGVVLLIVSQFTGLYYTFDETNHYQRAPAFIICYVFPLSIMTLQLSVIVQYYSRLSRSVRIPLLLFTVIPLLASVLQIFVYGLSLTNITIVGLAVMLYVFALQNMNRAVAEAHQTMLKKQEEDRLFIREMTEAFAKTIDMKDKYTNGHSSRVAQYTAMLARELGYDKATVEKYYNIALLHDIGKIGIPEQVLNKPGRLTDEEYRLIQSHSILGYETLKDISIMPELASGAGAHHERPDGKGYPNHLAGDQIPRVAQLISVADTFDAMYSNRPYRKRMNFDRAVSIIREVSGTQLVSDVVDAFLRLVEKGEFRDPNDTGGGSVEEISNASGDRTGAEISQQST